MSDFFKRLFVFLIKNDIKFVVNKKVDIFDFII